MRRVPAGRGHVLLSAIVAGVVLMGLTPRPSAAQTSPTAATAGQSTPGAPAEPPPSAWRRWIEPQVGTLSARYRLVENGAGTTTTNQVQHKQTLRVRVRFDRAGAYGVTVGALTGSSFTGSWNPTGAGTGEPTFDFFPRQLYASGSPVQAIEVQVGGLYVQRGDVTETISYDNDGYIMGERLIVRAPEQIVLDEITVTAGYVGDEPNVFERGDRLGDWNYGQLLAVKKLAAGVSLTGEYTATDDAHVLRSAAVVRSRRVPVADLWRYEHYIRLDRAEFGFDIEAQKSIGTRLTVGLGYADIDPFIGEFNADRFGHGRRLYGSGVVRLPADFTLQTWIGHAVGERRHLANGARFDLILEYDLLRSLTRSGILR
jgi:hypothetical protein